jgi:hypothetical protein
MIELRAVSDYPADLECIDVGERFIEHEKVVIGESRQLHRLRAGAGVRDDVPMLLKDALQSSAHPIVAAGNEGEVGTFRGQ